MAQKILLRRGGIGNIGSTIAVSKGELLFASGSTNGVENVVFIANADGNNTFTPVSKLYTGTAGADTFSARLDGLPYYNTTSQSLHILTNGGSVTPLDLSGNLEGNTVSSMTITTLTNTTLNGGTIVASGNITGSNLRVTGNADIVGNVTIGGNITVGDQTTDFINFGAEVSSSIVPDADNAFTLGTSSKRWQVYGVNSSISGSFTGSFGGNFTGTINGGSSTSGTGTTNQITKWLSSTTIGDSSISDDGTNVRVTPNLIVTGSTNLLGNVTLSGNSQTVTHTGTGNLTIASTGGNVLIEGTTFNGNDVSIAGNLTVLGTQTQIDSTIVNIGDNIIVLNAGGTIADGGIQVVDAVSTTGTGSLLWNATSDYWYAGVSGSTHYRLTTYANQSGGTTNYVPKVDSNDRLVDSIISDDGSTVLVAGTISGSILNASTGITAVGLQGVIDTSSRVIFRDASNRLGALGTTDSAIEVSTVLGYKADGTLVATSVIDGGTF
jgi:hypothetical protein